MFVFVLAYVCAYELDASVFVRESPVNVNKGPSYAYFMRLVDQREASVLAVMKLAARDR